MTKEHLETGPSSIRDDSICESSLPPNKSSGDKGERTWTPEQFWEFAAAFLGDHEATTSRTMIEDRGLVLIPAAEIERLRREVEETRSACAQTSNSYLNRALTAESAVAAAWEKAEKHAVAALGQHGSMMFIQEHGWAGLMEVVASAIRAACAEKTAESGHSPSTHNSASEFSDKTKAAIKEIDDNRRNAVIMAHTLVAGSLTSCRCASPMIKCDHTGCRCTTCGELRQP